MNGDVVAFVDVCLYVRMEDDVDDDYGMSLQTRQAAKPIDEEPTTPIDEQAH